MISESLTRTVKVNSSFQLSSRAVHYTGPFGNSGPMPPRVGQNTTYTILWSITNSSNDVSRAKVTAVLPLYVKWTGVSSSGDVSFNYGTGKSLGTSAAWMPAWVQRAPRARFLSKSLLRLPLVRSGKVRH